MLNHIDLCSGIGGFSLGFEWAGLSKPILFCDTEEWCRKILKKHWPNVPIVNDVKEIADDPDRFIPETNWRRTILTAGYPCQPFSVAGSQKGFQDDRHIWPFIFRIVAQKRPAICVFENVNGHITLGLDSVLNDLESEGYATRAFIIPAVSTGAPHRRDRVWIIAYLGDTEYNGPSTTEVKGINEEDAAGSSQRKEKTIKLEGTSRYRNESDVAHTTSRKRNARSEKHEALQTNSKNGRKRDYFGRSGTAHIESMANTNNSRDRAFKHEINENGKKIKQGWKIQPQFKSSGLNADVANTDNEGLRTRIRGSDDDNAKNGRDGSDYRRRGTENDEWNNTQTSKNEKLDVANTENGWWEQTKSERGESIGRGSANSRGSARTRQETIRDETTKRRDMANTESEGLERRIRSSTISREIEESYIGNESSREEYGQGNFESCMGRGVLNGLPPWVVETVIQIPRVSSGVKDRVHRLKGLGNAILPQISYQIGTAIKKTLVKD